MKGRSHRLPTSEPDDWGDGSWTVDCVCGVNFDDGEEMVSCDECGIWVHTRCSRFVKGETSFACDKCKSKKSKKENEETEVAQLLVELPTKTMRMDSYSTCPSFRLWTDIPIEERVHVQGMPAGDPALFQGLSSVFSSELWKCTGYVPKKFYFQYREFPCWDEKPGIEPEPGFGSQLQADEAGAGDIPVEEENGNPVDRGADVLFSLSKDIPYTPMGKFDMRSSIDGVDRECHTSPKEVKKQDSNKGLGSKQLHNSAKRERNQHNRHSLHSNKRRKEDMGSKDHLGKKAKSVDREADNERRGSSVEKVHQSKRPTLMTDMCQLEFHEDGSYEALNTGFQDLKNEINKEELLLEPDFDGHHGCHEAQDNGNKSIHKIVVKTLSASISNEGNRHGKALETFTRTEKIDHQASRKNEIPPRTDTSAEVMAETHDVARISIKEEDVKPAADGLNFLKDESHYMWDLDGDPFRVAADSQKSSPSMGQLMSSVPVVPDTGMSQDSHHAIPPSSAQPNGKVKKEVQDDLGTGESESFTVCHRKLDVANNLPHQFSALERSDGHLSEILQGQDIAISSLQSGQHKSQDSEAISSCDGNYIQEKMLSRSYEDQLHRQESEELTELLTSAEGSSQPRPSAKFVVGSSKSGGTDPDLPVPRVCKLIVGVGNAPVPGSTTKSLGSIKLSISSSHKASSSPLSSTTSKSTHFSKYRLKSHLTADGDKEDNKKDDAAKDVLKEESVQVLARAPIKDHTKGSTNSGLKTTHVSRVTHASASKHPHSDSKEQVFSPPSKASLSSLDVAISSGSGDPMSLSQPVIASQNKQTASGSCQKSEKIIQSSMQPSSKLSNSNHSPSMHPPAPVSASAALSDEELALLLHQELNSSPRVPRVPRVRHAGSLPQLASSTTLSMLVKRSSMSSSASSSVGVKDQNLVLKRKNKEDMGRDSSRNTRELMDETQKMDKPPSSPNQRCQDPFFKSDDSSRKNFENKSSHAFVSGKKTTTLTSTTIGSTCPSSYVETIDQNQSSMRSSPRDVADDDASATVGANTQTLPGLIGEIMSKGRRMSYEELCDAVRPHWHNLRKQNGERYAYSSHSHAVLDCLRNRNEWAQLVDRGPKTNVNRKRRKVYNDQPGMESDSEDAESRGAKVGEGKTSESHRDDVPKGKRKARRGRQLALHGRVRKDVRNRRNGAHLTDDDLGALSPSSEESMFSEEESRGARSRSVESEISSSDETS